MGKTRQLGNLVNISINTTAPLSGGGSLVNGLTLSISKADTSTDGYLSSTDWNTFNNKQAALGYTPYNATNPNGYINTISGLNISSLNNDSGYITSSALTNYVDLTNTQTVAGVKTFSDNLIYNNGTVKASIQAVPTIPSYAGLFLNVTPNSSNYSLVNDGSGNTFLNGTSSVYISANATNVGRFGTTFQLHTPLASASGSIVKWQLTIPADTGLTASTNISNWKILGNTKQFTAGALATQYFNYITANTLDFTSLSTATDVFSLFIEKTLATANANIVNNYGIGTNGSIKVGENLNLPGISNASKTQVLTYDITTKNVSYFTFSGTMFKDTTNSSDLTGTTEQIAKSVLIPANTFTTGDIVFIEVRNRKTSSAGSTDHYIKINTSNTLTGATQVGLLTTTATGFIAGFSRNLCIKSASVTETVAATTSFTTDLGQPTGASDLNIDWTVNQYLIIPIKNATGTDTCRNSYLVISKK